MKKRLLNLFKILMISIIIGSNFMLEIVNASTSNTLDPDHKDHVAGYDPSRAPAHYKSSDIDVSLGDNDYELTCKYNDGTELTISRNGVYLTNYSQQVGSSAEAKAKMFLRENQRVSYDSNGKISGSKTYNLLQNNRCPSILYMYSVPAEYDESATEEEKDAKAKIYYYATSNNIAEEIASRNTYFLFIKTGTEAAATIEKSTSLISEEAYLLSSKEATICDYDAPVDDSYSFNSALSLYLYKNVSFASFGGRVTILPNVLSECPAALNELEIKKDNPGKKYLYLNDPLPKYVAGDIAKDATYNSIRFYASNDQNSCKSNNDGNECQTFQFIGARTGDPASSTENDVCQLLGNRTITTLRSILGWLQILVPALVIILIGLDITKMVLSGNLDEELPKKKKSIIIRLIIMVIFFFAPTIVGIIIQLLNQAGVNVGDLQCFF